MIENRPLASPHTGPDLSHLHSMAPSSAWPPRIGQDVREILRYPGPSVPKAFWEFGYDRQPRPVTRWAYLWRLRLHPRLSMLGALHEDDKLSFRELAWPAMAPRHWSRLWTQLLDVDQAFPNLLPMSTWTEPQGIAPFVCPPVLTGTLLLWSLMDPSTIATWARVRSTSHRQMQRAIGAIWDSPAADPTRNPPVGGSRDRQEMGVPDAHPPNVPNPQRLHKIFFECSTQDHSPRYWGHSLEDEFHRWRRAAAPNMDLTPAAGYSNIPPLTRSEHFQGAHIYTPPPPKAPYLGPPGAAPRPLART